MSRTVFADTNVVIDLLEKREPFYRQSVELFSLSFNGKLSVYVSGTTFTTASYLLRKHTPQEIRALLGNLRQIVKVAPIDESVIDKAIASAAFDDYEDAVQYFSALSVGAELIITRNERDFLGRTSIPVVSPTEFLWRL